MKHPKTTHAHAEASIANPFQSPLNGSMVEAIGRGASTFGRSATTFHQEGLRFMTRRLEQNIKAVERFSVCKSLPDLVAAQQQWFADMTRAYSEEWKRCSELMAEAQQEVCSESGNGRASQSADHTH